MTPCRPRRLMRRRELEPEAFRPPTEAQPTGRSHTTVRPPRFPAVPRRTFRVVCRTSEEVPVNVLRLAGFVVMLGSFVDVVHGCSGDSKQHASTSLDGSMGAGGEPTEC